MDTAILGNLIDILGLTRAIRDIQGVSKKVYNWKVFPKVTSAQNLRKLSGSLAPSGSSS